MPFGVLALNGILGAMQVNGRSVEVQLMRKLLAGWFVWDVKFPSEFQENFMPFFAQEKGDFSDHFIVSNATQLFNSARYLNLGDFQWSDLTLLAFQIGSSILFLIQINSEYSLIAIRQCTQEKRLN